MVRRRWLVPFACIDQTSEPAVPDPNTIKAIREPSGDLRGPPTPGHLKSVI